MNERGQARQERTGGVGLRGFILQLLDEGLPKLQLFRDEGIPRGSGPQIGLVISGILLLSGLVSVYYGFVVLPLVIGGILLLLSGLSAVYYYSTTYGADGGP